MDLSRSWLLDIQVIPTGIAYGAYHSASAEILGTRRRHHERRLNKES